MGSSTRGCSDKVQEIDDYSASAYNLLSQHKTRVETDASDHILGGVLFQREDDGLLHPIMYASRKCLDREMRYDIQNKEMTALPGVAEGSLNICMVLILPSIQIVQH